MAVFNVLILSALPFSAGATFNCTTYQNQFTLSTTTSGTVVNISTGYPVYCSAGDLAVQVINYLSAISGTVVIIFLIIGGFLYVTSAGNEEQSEKARKIITNSIIGLVVIILAFTIVKVVSSLLTLGH